MTAFLIAISAVCALTYGIWFCHQPTSWLRTGIKTAAIGLLSVVAGLEGGAFLLVLALALSALGDFALSQPGQRAFLVGLCSFALAHIFYILLFLGLAEGLPTLLPVLILVAYAISTEFWLAPHTGDMRGPVRVYVLLITGMGLSALALPDAMIWALVGAGAFVVSDTVLAIQLFRLGPESRWYAPFARWLWAFYYIAQLLILRAMLG